MPYSRSSLVDIRASMANQPQVEPNVAFPKEIQRPVPQVVSSIQQSTAVYSRQNLIEIRQATSQLSTKAYLHCPAINRDRVYSREQLQAIRHDLSGPTLQREKIPEEIRSKQRFRCPSDCANEQQHEIKRILKYTRDELILVRDATSCSKRQPVAFSNGLMSKTAPEILARPMGR